MDLITTAYKDKILTTLT